MNNLRAKTRDRLLRDDNQCLPPSPNTSIPQSVFEDLLYWTAKSDGYIGTEEEFGKDFINALNNASGYSAFIFQADSPENFPEEGVENGLYIDNIKNKLYFWKENTYNSIISDLPENLILYGGNAETN